MCKVFSFFNSVSWEALYYIVVFLHIFLFKCLCHVCGINMGEELNPL